MRADHALRGVWVEVGRSAIVMRHEPISTRLGHLLGGLGLLLVLGLLVRGGANGAASET